MGHNSALHALLHGVLLDWQGAGLASTRSFDWSLQSQRDRHAWHALSLAGRCKHALPLTCQVGAHNPHTMTVGDMAARAAHRDKYAAAIRPHAAVKPKAHDDQDVDLGMDARRRAAPACTCPIHPGHHMFRYSCRPQSEPWRLMPGRGPRHAKAR